MEQTRLDGILVNALTRMGTSEDVSEHTFVGYKRRFSVGELEELYKDPLLRRVCHAKAESAIIKGWTLDLGSKDEAEIVEAYQEYEQNLEVANRFADAQIQANIYRGAAIVILADDGRKADQPIDQRNLKRIIGLEVLNSQQIRPEMTDIWNPEHVNHYEIILPRYFQNRNDPQPKNGSNYFRIHRDRVIRFDGVRYPPSMMLKFDGWGGSLLELIWEDYRTYISAIKAASALLTDYSFFILKEAGLKDLVISSTQEAQDQLTNRYRNLRMTISALGGLAIDKDFEEVDFVNRALNGVDSLIDKLREVFIGSTNIPHDQLFGESPSGLGATGEDERRVWAKTTHEFQTSEWLPKLRRLARFITAAKDGPTKGEAIKNAAFLFHSILTQSQEEIANQRSTEGQTIGGHLLNGVITNREYRNYLASTEFAPFMDEEDWKTQQQQANQAGNFPGFPAEENESYEDSGLSEEERVTGDSLLYRLDEYKPIKRVETYAGIPIGITHDPGDIRFGTPMIAAYGHIRGSYGEAEDGDAIDVFISPDSRKISKIYKVRQIDKNTGLLDEYKYFLGFDNPTEVKSCFCKGAGESRFGGIEETTIRELGKYRKDAEDPSDRAEELVALSLEKSNPIIESWVGDTLDWLDKLPDISSVQANIDQLYSALNGDDFAQIVEETNVVAYISGTDEVQNEIGI